MGNDGGSIPTRRELVKSPTRHQTHSQLRSANAQTQAYHWTTCPLSKRPLAQPVVSDVAGRLYNKESILEWILRGAQAFGDGGEVLGGRVRSLRDVVEVGFEDGEEGWVCPVSRREFGAGVRAVYLVPCGHAFLESAVKEVGGGRGVCLKCEVPYEPENVIPINPVVEGDVERLRVRAEALAERGLTHALKPGGKLKQKKRKKGGDGNGNGNGAAAGGIKHAATASLTDRVLEDEKVRSKRRKVGMSDNLKSLFSKGGELGGGGGGGVGKSDFMSRGYSIPGGK